MKKKVMSLILYILSAAALVVPDRLTKLWAADRLRGSADIIWIPGVFQLHYLENQGMAFGLLQNRILFFCVMTAAVLILILYLYLKTPSGRRYLPVRFVLILVTAGAAGNFIDRVSQGYVVDFLYFSLIDFPVFNVADIYVTCSCLIILVLLLFVYRDEELTGIYGRKS